MDFSLRGTLRLLRSHNFSTENTKMQMPALIMPRRASTGDFVSTAWIGEIVDQERDVIKDRSNRFFAAVAAAGQAVLAVRSGLGILALRIEPTQVGDEAPYRGCCTPRRFRGSLSTLRWLLAGEVAQAVLDLQALPDIDLLATHSAAADTIRAWVGYWSGHDQNNSYDDAVEEEIGALISLVRCQVRRSLAAEPERSTIENLALLIRDKGSLVGAETEKFVRENCRSGMPSPTFVIPISE